MGEVAVSAPTRTAGPAGDAAARPLVELRGVRKHYPGVQAVEDVSLEIRPGEVHAVCGENGAGKSTLMKLVARLERIDAGEILLRGERIDHHTPRHVQDRGIAMVSQELALAPDLTIAENLMLGRERRFVLAPRGERRAARELLARVGLDVDPGRRVVDLSVAEQQLIEIAKALAVEHACMTIMDEPTASLTGSEIERLFEVVERLRADGIAVVYITHRLEEIFRLADRVTVMRDGRLVTTLPRAELDEDALVRLMVGRDIDNLYPKPDVAPGEVVLDAQGITVPGRVHDCSLRVRAGEIVGLAGIVGAGRSELARALFGAERMTAGRVHMHGKLVTPGSPREAIRSGIGYVTEDRKGDGLALNLSVMENITLVELPTRAGFIRRREEREAARRACETFDVRTASIDCPVQLLSGGNQQKAMVARWVRADTDLLIFDEPARGIDIGAKAEMFELIGELARRGKAVVMISSYLPELLNMCDRVVVMRDGRIAGEVPRERFSEERVIALATTGRGSE